MNLIYKVKNIALRRCADMIESDDYRLISKAWMPKKYLKSKFDEFIFEFNTFLFDNDNKHFFGDEWRKTMYYHKASTVLPLLFLGIKHTEDKKYIDYYEKYYGKFIDKEKSLNRINGAISTLNNRIKDLNEATNEENRNELEKFSLWKLIEGVEFLLERPIDLDINLSIFKMYLKRATQKAK